MNRTIGAVLTAGVLFLAGCSGASDQPEKVNTQETTKESGKTDFAQVGDTIRVDCIGNECRGEFEVEEIQLGGECKTLFAELDIPEELQLVQISGIVSATNQVKDNEGNEIGVYPEEPVAWDSEDFKTTAKWHGACDIPQGYEHWAILPAKMGEKVRTYGAYLIPKDAKELGIANSKFDLTKVGTISDQADEKTSAKKAEEKKDESAQPVPSEQQPAAPARPAEDPAVGYTEAPGQVAPHVMEKQIASCGDPEIHQTGTTFFTDGTSGWTQNCADQMM